MLKKKHFLTGIQRRWRQNLGSQNQF